MNLEEWVSQIVRQTVKEYLGAAQTAYNVGEEATGTGRFKNVLVLTVEHSSDTEDLVGALSQANNVQVCRCSANTADVDYSEAVCQADVVVVPVLRLATLSKAALLIDDDPMSAAIIQALMSGKSVVAAASGILPSGAGRLSVPPAVVDTVQTYLQRLSQYGIHLTTRKKLHYSVNRVLQSGPTAKRPLVHARHVRDWVNEGETVIVLPDHAVLTPLAKEEAKDLGLRWNAKPKGE